MTATQNKTPQKPSQSDAPLQVLLDHYHARLERYNEATVDFYSTRAIDPATKVFGPVDETFPRKRLIERIRRMHVRLKDTIRDRAIALLLEKKLDPETGDVLMDGDGRLIGLSYGEILEILKEEHPYSSTSAACLRWYVVQVSEEYDDDGELVYEFPDFRPRSKPKSPRKKRAPNV